ncbi:MAG: DNA recombination protein RmuC [Candidatus Aureabacteria bacterium]|nr:DNA recombination protein RmuC [Candidatus Auribacterota bacterium]
MINLQIILIILLILLILGGFSAILLVLKSLKKSSSQDEHIFKLQGQIESLSSNLNERIFETNENIQKQFSKQFTESIKIVKDVTEQLVKLDETNKQIVDYTTELKKLENILKSPKQRGILGEYFLETMLSNIFAPTQFKMQYKFPDGTIVDAAIFVKDKIIPVDAKFSLEKFEALYHESDQSKIKVLEKELRNDFKTRIKETKKYIMPQNDTTDFAIMFIPAEGVFYHFLSMKVGSVDAGSINLLEYAFSEKVIITSPTTFFAYLQTILQALKALSIEESVKDVIKRVSELGRHIEKHNDFMLRLGNNLSKTVSSYNTAYKELGKIDKDIVKITGKEKAIEVNSLDKPSIE